jgi:hypothetical protein
LRNVSSAHKDYQKAIDFLLPRKVDLGRYLGNAWCIALPSILESLQKGIIDKFHQYVKSILKNGFESTIPEIFDARHNKLQFQFRMHPEIARFSCEQFYDSKALQNSSMTCREWDYRRYNTSPYKSRFTWIDVKKGIANYGKNEREAFFVMQELKKFVAWAKFNKKDPENYDNDPKWSVAILTYYRGQERYLRGKLQEYTGQKIKTNLFNKDGIEIILHTVDKIQGREADLVILTMVRTAKNNEAGYFGFMDNPNRLNVALTRAKYQLVILGQRYNFLEQDDCVFLKALAGGDYITIEGIEDTGTTFGEHNAQTNISRRKKSSDVNDNASFITHKFNESLRNRHSVKPTSRYSKPRSRNNHNRPKRRN